MEKSRAELLKMDELSLPGRSCYAYKGNMYMCDESKSEPHDNFYLLQLVTEKLLSPTSGESTPRNDESGSVVGSISEVSDIQAETIHVKDVLEKIPDKKIKTMKDIAPTRTAVCPLWGSKGLLVRFRGTPQDDREAVAAQKPGKKPSGHEDNDKKIARMMVTTFLKMRKARLNAQKKPSTSGMGDNVVSSTDDVHTPVDAKGPPMRIVVEGEQSTENADEEPAESADTQQEGSEPPAKRMRMSGHRKEVPIEIVVPEDFLTWKKVDQNHYIYRQRVKYFDPAKHAEQTQRASVRSSASYRRRRIPEMLDEAVQDRANIEKAELEGDTVKANKIRDQLRNKLEKVDRYRQEVRDFNDTRARDVEPKKYNKFEAKRRSKRTDEWDKPLTENDLTVKTTDGVLVGKLKTQYARQVAVHEATCKALLDVMSQKCDQSTQREREWDVEVATLKNELESAQRQLKDARLQLRRHEENSRAMIEEAVRNAMSKHATTSQPNLVSDIEQDILSNLNVTFFDDERTVDDEIREEVAKAEAKAARTAQLVREKHKAKVTSLCDRIAQVKRELKDARKSLKSVVGMRDKLEDMMIFPNDVGKDEVMIWKTLMAKWRRRTLGFAFDPEPDMDIQWEEERSSGDYDSEDEHSSVEGDSSEDELTTEGEDDLEEAETVEVEGQADKATEQQDKRDVPAGEDEDVFERQSEPVEKMETGGTSSDDSALTTETDTDDTEKWWEDRNLKFNTSDEELDSEHEREEEPNEQQVQPQEGEVEPNEQQVEPNEEQVEPNEKQDEPNEKQDEPEEQAEQQVNVEEEEGEVNALFGPIGTGVVGRILPEVQKSPRRIQLCEAREGFVTNPVFQPEQSDSDSEEESLNIHVRSAKDAAPHPVEDAVLESDLSLREYSFERRAHYEKEVSKSMRDFIVMDDSDVYDSDENEQRDKLMWGDVQSVGYKYRDGSEIGPKSMKVCHTYDSAKRQYDKANLARLEAVVQSTQKVAAFGEKEAERIMLEQGPTFEQEDEKHRDEEMEKEMEGRFTGAEDDPKRSRKKKTLQERAEEEKKRREFVWECRRRVEKRARQQIRDSENRVGEFMGQKFPRYVHLRHHLMDFQKENVMKQFSKTTPDSELSKYNLFLGSERHTEKKFEDMDERKTSSAAREREEVTDEEVDEVVEDEQQQEASV